jgi:hypothetical protein
MRDWPSDAEDREQSRPDRWWRDHWNDLGPKHQLRDDLFVSAGALLYLAVLIWPICGIVFQRGHHPEYPTLIGGLIGLLVSSYAAMSDRVQGGRRALIAATGFALIVGFWGFGPL